MSSEAIKSICFLGIALGLWAVGVIIEAVREAREEDALADAIMNEAEADAMVELHEAAHPNDILPYDITKPMPLHAPWDVVLRDTIPYDLRLVIHPDPVQVDDRKLWN